MYDYTVREVDYNFFKANLHSVVATEAFMNNHKITQNAYDKTKQKYKSKFIEF